MKRRADGRWVKKITLPNGKSKYFYSSEITEKKATADISHQLLNYEAKQEEGKLFQHVADAWERQHFPTLRENSLKLYRSAKKEVVNYFYDTPISSIQPFHINAMLTTLANKGYAQKTVKGRLLVLNLIFKFALINQYITNNPCQFITPPKNLPKSKRDTISSVDMEKIKINYDKPFGLFALFILVTGCRRGEALALDPSTDIDWQNNIAHINKTVEWIGNKPHIKNSPKTDAGVRDIPLPEFLITLLSPFKQQKYLFPNSNGELMDNSQVTRAWKNYQKETGITATPHQLRHAYATILFDAGIDIKTAQRFLGHADIKTTLDIYTHLSENRLESSTNKLLDFLSKNFES